MAGIAVQNYSRRRVALNKPGHSIQLASLLRIEFEFPESSIVNNQIPISELPFVMSENHPGSELLGVTMHRVICSKTEAAAEEYAHRPVYLQDWWLNITAPPSNQNRLIGNHKLSVFEGGRVAGTMTYTIFRNRLGVKEGRDPILSRVGGPLIPDDKGDTALSQRRRDKIVSELIAQLPLNVSHIFTLPPDSTDHTLFMAAGFTYNYEYSYRIPPGDATEIRAGFFRKLRSRLRKAESDLDISTATPEQFIEFYTENLNVAGLRPVFPFDTAYQLLKEGLKRGQARITIAHYKGASVPVAALATVWDQECYYTWLATYRLPERQKMFKRLGRRAMTILAGKIPPTANSQQTSHPCAVRFLFWNAMLDAHSRGLTFDLDGTRKTDTEHLYKEFNGLRVVRHVLSRQTLTYRFWITIREPLMAALKSSVGLFGPFFH